MLNHTYRQWRTMQKENPTVCRLMGFQNDPKKSDDEKLRWAAQLRRETPLMSKRKVKSAIVRTPLISEN